MPLTKIERRRAPLDGSWFCTTANLNSILRAATDYDDDKALWPEWAQDARVPVWIRMEKYKAQETHEVPDGMIWGPIIRVGTAESPDVRLHGRHHAAGLFHDYQLDPGYRPDQWLYTPFGYASLEPPGEDVSVYRCDQCGNNLFRDDMGRRQDLSACIYEGSLVCRDCDFRGLIYSQDSADRIDRCRAVARRVGGDCLAQFEKRLEFLTPSDPGVQRRLFPDGVWSFYFSTLVFTENPRRTARGMNGGLIQHGPSPTLDEDGTWKFNKWDYKENRLREATEEEVRNITWEYSHMNQDAVFVPLKHLGLDISASSGCGRVPHDECREALGAFLLAHEAGVPTEMTETVRHQDEVFEFTYKGRVWRFSFILTYDMQLGKIVPFRIDFDYLREARDDARA